MQETDLKHFEPEELIAWELLYRTIEDCYKIATGQWRHFRSMHWHEQYDGAAILGTARKEVGRWVNSHAFADYAHRMGYSPERAVLGARELLAGRNLETVEVLLKEIAKQRDSRRDRSKRDNGRRRKSAGSTRAAC